MKKMHGKICIITGTALLLAALSLVFFNLYNDSQSGKTAQRLLNDIKNEIPQSSQNSDNPIIDNPDDLFSEYNDADDEEKLIEADGMYYLGIISIPSLQIELPVLSEWSYPNLKLSPCRYKGTVKGGDLIIAAHNYRTHFGRIQELVSGDIIIFTDANGVAHEYETVQTESINGKDIEAMEFGAADNWDLTLFTCTLSGQSRVTVRAVSTEQAENK